MKCTGTRGTSILIGLLIFVFGLWLGWQANSLVAQDICLDRGGAWDKDTRSCAYK